MKLPSFVTGQFISLVGGVYPFKFIAELSSAAAKMPDCATPPLLITGIAHIGFMAYFSEKDNLTVKDGDFCPKLDGYETDEEDDWDDDDDVQELRSSKGMARRSGGRPTSFVRGASYSVKKFTKKGYLKTKDVLSVGIGRSDSN